MIVLLNHAAGGPTLKTSAETIGAVFAAAGIEAQFRVPDSRRSLSVLAREAAQADDPVVVAAGGDGTISTVAAALVGREKILGVLPMGTFNHFAKDLGVPLTLEAAVQVIASGQVARVDAGEVNGRLFINNSSLGIYPLIVADRQTQQERQARGKWEAFLWAVLRTLRRYPFLNLKITLEGRAIERRSAFVFIGNNRYEVAGFELGSRPSLTEGDLGLYLTHRTGRLGLLRLAWGALCGRLDQAKDFEAFSVAAVTIETRPTRMLVAIDGEVIHLTTPLHYRTRPGVLRVLVPPQSLLK